MLFTRWIGRSSYDFSDSCTTLKNTMARCGLFNALFFSSKESLVKQRVEAQSEFEVYRFCQSRSQNSSGDDDVHIVVDFVEKVLVPRLIRHPGQLKFITGQIFDFSEFSGVISLGDIISLPKGHEFNEKTANVVCSMLEFVLSVLYLPGPGI